MPYLNPMLDALSPANIWFIAGILLLIFEMFTPGFFLASLSVGTFWLRLLPGPVEMIHGNLWVLS